MNGKSKALTLLSVLFSFTAQAFATGTPPVEEFRHRSETTSLIEQANDPSADKGSRDAAINALLANIENYQSGWQPNKGIYEDNLKARLKAIDSIWSLGEIGDPRLMASLKKFYAGSDDVIKMNIIISMSKLKKTDKAGPYVFDIAANPSETEVVRALAFEVLDLIKYPSTVVNLARSAEVGIDKADLLFTGGITGSISGWVSPDLPIGHAGLFIGTEAKDGKIKVAIADCVPDFFKPGGVRNIDSWHAFTHDFMYPYYGNRTTARKPTTIQRERIAKLAIEMGNKGLTYSDTHFSQKGPVKFDCVGYTEFLYEAVGLNPTENSYETGWGWPLTPWEQFIGVKPPSAKPQNHIALPGNGNFIVLNQATITRSFDSLTGAFGLAGVSAPEVSTDIQPELVN